MADFINIGVKEDSPAKLAYIAENNIPEKYWVSAGNIMLIVWAINQLKATAFTGDYGDLTNKPTLFKDWVAGSYLAGETVFHNGGIWISKSNGNESEPSLGATNWKLLAQINEGGVLGVNWENITGNQSAVSLSGFTNDGDGLHPFITAQDLSDFVQKIEGKGLSTNDFSDEFRNKLSSLVSSKFVGTYPNIEDLIEAYPEGLVGGYADVGVPGELVVRYEWSQSTYSWVIKESGSLIEGLIAKVNGIEEGAQVNKIEKVFVNGLEQNIEDKTVNISVQSSQAMLIQSQKPVITNIGGTSYSVVVPMNSVNKSIWQSPDGVIHEKDSNYTYTTDIDLSTHNRIDVIWVNWSGEMGHEVGDSVPVGTPTPYPVNIPSNAMQYTFITFINGATGVQGSLTPEQVQNIIDNSKPSTYELTADEILGSQHENKFVRVIGHVVLTIPSGLLSSFYQCFFYVTTGSSLTIALATGVTVEGNYGLVLNALERASLIKWSGTANNFIFG